MKAMMYGIWLQLRIDIRSKTMLITCYMVPLLFFAIMGGIFLSLTPDAETTLIPSMNVMGISMGALIGVPPSLVEFYASDVRKMYTANGVPMYFGVVVIGVSAFLHLMVMSVGMLMLAVLLFGAQLPENLPLYLGSLALVSIVSLCFACVLGVFVQNQAKQTMAAQLLFLPSIMLSGILFPASLLPSLLAQAGKLFPAAWGYRLLLGESFAVFPLCVMTLAALALLVILLKRVRLRGTMG